MMTNDYSLGALLEFADYLAEKGLMNKNSASARKAACSKLFGVLDAEEASDLREIEIEQVAMRFNNLEGGNYNPQSLRVYKSRASSALSDFYRYKKNPAAFKIEGNSKKQKNQSETRAVKVKRGSGKKYVVSNPSSVSISQSASVDLPIPLRKNCIVYVNGLPVDLTEVEAKKIAAVVSAMAVLG